MSREEKKAASTLITVNDDLANMVTEMKKIEKTNNKQQLGLNENEKKELTNRFKAMSRDDLELFMDLVPVEFCLNRIQKELDKAKLFEDSIKNAMAGLR